MIIRLLKTLKDISNNDNIVITNIDCDVYFDHLTINFMIEDCSYRLCTDLEFTYYNLYQIFENRDDVLIIGV